MGILTEENLVGAKTAPTATSTLGKENQVSLVVRAFLSEPGSGSKIGRLGGGGWKKDPEKTLRVRLLEKINLA